jgi:hypothetical protein
MIIYYWVFKRWVLKWLVARSGLGNCPKRQDEWISMGHTGARRVNSQQLAAKKAAF